MKLNKNKCIFLQILIIVIVSTISACNKASIENVDSSAPLPVPENSENDDAVSQTPFVSITEPEMGLPANPVKFTFPASDGNTVNGIFYPAKYKSQPLIILMHWAPGDQNDWLEIAFWLQNRGLGGFSKHIDGIPWLDPIWFPEIDPQVSYNVFTFTFRNCENGCEQFQRAEWYQDVQAAVEFAYGLNQIDNEKILMVGASIGSDGAADGCAYLNTLHPGVCKGVLAFSPGNYLTVDFGQIVDQLGAEVTPKPVWCFYSESDIESANTCGRISESNFQAFAYNGNSVFSNGHGMNLLTPLSDPNPLEKLLEFLEINY